MNKKPFIRAAALLVAVVMLAAFVAMAFVTAGVLNAKISKASNIPQTSARAMCTVEASSGRVLYSKNAEEPLPMASTTKIITAITVLEHCADPDEVVEIDDRAIGIEGTSIYLKKGETMTVRELLYGLMLRSGNDAAAALALHICPKNMFDEFSALMNNVAARAGATNSSFKNPHGLDAEGHYTTARDLARVSAYAMQNPVFAEIVGTKNAKISGTEYPRVIQNKNRLLRAMPDCVGIKTGFTKKAGRCYVGAIDRNGMTIVSVVLNCGPMFEDAAALLDAAAEEFTMTKILAKDEFIDYPTGVARENFFYPLRDGEDVDIVCRDNTVEIFLDNQSIYSAPFNKM